MSCYPGQPVDEIAVDSTMEAGSMRIISPRIDQTKSDSLHMMDNEEGLKPHSTHTTIKWLEENYYLEEGVCLPRSTIYKHYIDFCQRERNQPVNAASFGKIIRQLFPSLTTRRLGTRGQSKYHYYGLGIKRSSHYFSTDYSDKMISGVNKKVSDNRKQQADKPSAVLPPFPNVLSLNISENLPLDKLKTFVVMYRAHCQRIVDSVVRANFNEVENFLLHFWKGMPTHMLPVLASDVVVDIVAHCDVILYRVINNVLISSPLQILPGSLANDIQTFCDTLRQWLEKALDGLPESLQEAKYKVAEGFTSSIKRQTALTQLAEITRTVLHSNNMMEQVKEDWEAIDLIPVYTQLLYTLEPLDVPSRYQQIIPSLFQEFSVLLDHGCDLEQLLSWTEDIVKRTVIKAFNEEHYSLKKASQVFIFTWKSFTAKILRELTLESAASFGCFHLLNMLVEDYIIHLLETQLERQDENLYSCRLNTMQKENSEPILGEDEKEQSPIHTPSPLLHNQLPDSHLQHHTSTSSLPSSSMFSPSDQSHSTASGSLSFNEPFTLAPIQVAPTTSTLIPSPSPSSIASSTIGSPPLLGRNGAGLHHNNPTVLVPHAQSTSSSLNHSLSLPHLPFAATMDSQQPTNFSAQRLPSQAPVLQPRQQQQQQQQQQQHQQQQQQQYHHHGYQIPPSQGNPNHPSCAVVAGQEIGSPTLSHPFPIPSSTTITYSSLPSLPTDLSSTGSVMGRHGLLQHVTIPSLPTLSVSLSHTSTSPTSSSAIPTPSNIPFFPQVGVQSVYPYPRLMSLSTMPQLPTQMNTPFGSAGLQGQTNPVAGYPYIPPSLYTSNPQVPVCTAAFTR